MSSPPPVSPFDQSLEALRRDHPNEYRQWVLVALLASLFGYTASWLVSVSQHQWRDAFRTTDPFVALADLVALAFLYRRYTTIAACLALAAAWADVHVSLLTVHQPRLSETGLVVPAFVLATSLLFGGRLAFVVAGTLALSMPTTLWLASALHLGSGLADPTVLHFVVALEGTLVATTALLAAFLLSFAELLRQHERSEARSRELQAQLLHAQKLEAVGLLAGGIAHDFNNLLTEIGGHGVLLARSTDPRARESGEELMATQKRGATLTRQLLAFARKDIAQPKPMDIARTLRDLRSLLARASGQRVRLQLDCEPECVMIADPGQIEQVVLNLVLNARDAMPEGGRLWIRCGKSDDQVRLEVEDEGVGMDEATKARVFEPFFTTKGRDSGTGLGLSTVHGIVLGSGGSVELETQLGRGTRFIMRWPRAAAIPERENATPVSLAGAGRFVLLVEHNDGVRPFVQRLLSDRGFRVESARDADEALELASKYDAAPDLVVCDVIMPGLTGPELVEQLKARWPALCCLFTSGYLGETSLGAGFAMANDLVPKPFTATELLERIARKLEECARR